jgi:hypothetical protein
MADAGQRHRDQVAAFELALEQARFEADPAMRGRRWASPLGRMAAEAAGASVDRAGRVQINPDCKLPGHSEVLEAHA